MQILEISYFTKKGVVTMNKFATGLIAGGIIGAAGVAVAMSDRKQRKYVVKGSKKAFRKAGSFMDNMTDMF